MREKERLFYLSTSFHLCLYLSEITPTCVVCVVAEFERETERGRRKEGKREGGTERDRESDLTFI